MILGLFLTLATTCCCFALGATTGDNSNDSDETGSALRNLLDLVYSDLREILKVFDDRRRDVADAPQEKSENKPESTGRGRSPLKDDVVFADGLNVGNSLFSGDDASWDELDDDSEKDGLNSANYLGAFFKKRNYGAYDDELDQKDGADKSKNADRKWARLDGSEKSDDLAADFDAENNGDRDEGFDDDEPYDTFDDSDYFDRILEDESISYAQKVKRLRDEFESGRRTARVQLVYALINYVDELNGADEKIATEALDEARDLLSPDQDFSEEGEFFDPNDPEIQKLLIYVLLQRSIFRLKNDVKPDIESVNEALNLARELYNSYPVDESQLVLARVYVVQGNVYLANGLEEVALNSFQAAYDTVDESDLEEEVEEKVVLRGLALRARAEAYRRIGDFQQELKTFREVVDYWKERGDRDVYLAESATAAFHLAATLQRTSPRESLACLDEAIAAQERLYSFDESKYAVELVMYLNIRADRLFGLGEQVEALAVLDRAISIAAQYLEAESNTKKREVMFRLAADSYLRRGSARFLLGRSTPSIVEDCHTALQMLCRGMKYDPTFDPRLQILILLFFMVKVLSGGKENATDIGEIVRRAEELYERLNDSEKRRVRCRMAILYLQTHNFYAFNDERDLALEMSNRAVDVVGSDDLDDLSVEDREALVHALRQRSAFNAAFRRELRDSYRDGVETIKVLESLRRDGKLDDTTINAYIDSLTRTAGCCVAELKYKEARAYVEQAFRLAFRQIHNSEWDCQTLGQAVLCALGFARFDDDKTLALRLIRLALRIVKKLQIQTIELTAEESGDGKEELLNAGQKEKIDVLERAAIDFRLARIEILTEEEKVDEKLSKILGESPTSTDESEVESARRKRVPYYETLRRDLLFCVRSAARRATAGLDDAMEILEFSMRYLVRRLAWEFGDAKFAFAEIRNVINALVAIFPERTSKLLRYLLVAEKSLIPSDKIPFAALGCLEPIQEEEGANNKKENAFNVARSCVLALSDLRLELFLTLLGRRKTPSFLLKSPDVRNFAVSFLLDGLNESGYSSRKEDEYMKKLKAKLDSRTDAVSFSLTPEQTTAFADEAEKCVYASLFICAEALNFDNKSIEVFSKEVTRMLLPYRAIRKEDSGRKINDFSKRVFGVRYRNHELRRVAAIVAHCFYVGEFFFLESKVVPAAKAAYLKASSFYEESFERFETLDHYIDFIGASVAFRLASIYQAEKNREAEMRQILKAVRAHLRICEKSGTLEMGVLDRMTREVADFLKNLSPNDSRAIPRRAFQFLLDIDKLEDSWAIDVNAVVQVMTLNLADFYINDFECFSVALRLVERFSWSTSKRVELLTTETLFTSAEISEKILEVFALERNFWSLYGSLSEEELSVGLSLNTVDKILSLLRSVCSRVLRDVFAPDDSDSDSGESDDESGDDDPASREVAAFESFEDADERVQSFADCLSDIFDSDASRDSEENDEEENARKDSDDDDSADYEAEERFKAYRFWLKQRNLLRNHYLYLQWIITTLNGKEPEPSIFDEIMKTKSPDEVNLLKHDRPDWFPDGLVKTPEEHRLRFAKLWRDDSETDELRAYANECYAREIRRVDRVKDWFKRFGSKPAPKFKPSKEILAELELEILAYFVEETKLASPDTSPEETLRKNEGCFFALAKRVDFSPEQLARVYYSWSLFARRSRLTGLGLKYARMALQVLPRIEKSSPLVENALNSEIKANKRALLLRLEIEEHFCRLCLDRGKRGDLAAAEEMNERSLEAARKMFGQKLFSARPYYAKALVVAAKICMIRRRDLEARDLAKQANAMIGKCESREIGFWPPEIKADLREIDEKLKEQGVDESSAEDADAPLSGD